VADVFHAMTSERIYRAKQSPFKVLEMIKEEEFGKFNLTVVRALETLICDFTIGTMVKLTDGEICEILFLHRDATLRPLVRKRSDGETIDLAANRSRAIEKILY